MRQDGPSVFITGLTNFTVVSFMYNDFTAVGYADIARTAAAVRPAFYRRSTPFSSVALALFGPSRPFLSAWHHAAGAHKRAVYDLAFTRYSFTPTRSCTSQSSWYGFAHLHCSHDCNTIARLLRDIRPLPGFPFVCHNHTILATSGFNPSTTTHYYPLLLTTTVTAAAAATATTTTTMTKTTTTINSTISTNWVFLPGWWRRRRKRRVLLLLILRLHI